MLQLAERAVVADHPHLHRAEDGRRDAARGDDDAQPLVGRRRRGGRGELVDDGVGELGFHLPGVPDDAAGIEFLARSAAIWATASGSYGEASMADWTDCRIGSSGERACRAARNHSRPAS